MLDAFSLCPELFNRKKKLERTPRVQWALDCYDVVKNLIGGWEFATPAVEAFEPSHLPPVLSCWDYPSENTLVAVGSYVPAYPSLSKNYPSKRYICTSRDNECIPLHSSNPIDNVTLQPH